MMMPTKSTPSSSLPHAFISRMKTLLGADANRFFDTYQDAKQSGLRFNIHKLQHLPSLRSQLLEQFHCEPVSWCSEGYYYDELTRPGKHPYHAAGLYYIQEPSAMSAVELLQPKPGEVVLDLAAAPGGKSTQILSKIGSEGMLLANEIHPTRAKILSENIERWGAINTIVTQETPARLSARFPLFFDKILLDAPCSGEGMFRKDPEAISQWSEDHVILCAQRQADILDEAYKMLKPGGTLVYSTCTFSTEENEQAVEAFVERHPHMVIEHLQRLWPHIERGEGHFIAKLTKKQDFSAIDSAQFNHMKKRRKTKKVEHTSANVIEATDSFKQLQKQILPSFSLPKGELILFGEQLYVLPPELSSMNLQGLKVLRPGLHLAIKRKNRVEPAHALAMACASSSAALSINLPADHSDVAAFLRGESIALTHDERGWGLLCVDGAPLGWGKASNGQLKNHLPKGLRRFS